MPEKKEIRKEEPAFQKQDLLESKRFSGQRDLIEAVLMDSRKYSIREAEEAINKFLKGKVKTWH